ncbi:DNA cytosine methyltransferase [Actinophytocola sp.]|uniref:DNA cytosine methyltransferase n=1 Tax=Actinophytocola sp. TaxID=1872138 RepID=UPI002ED3D83E
MSLYLPWGGTGDSRLVLADEFDEMFPLAPRTVDWFRANTLGRRRGAGIDFFAGGGGFSIGAVLAGLGLELAGNHWVRSYETHSLNFPGTEHVIGDLSVVNPKRYRRGMANILICSPECRLHSNARNHVEAVAELSVFNPNRESERSRCTMWCPQRFAAWMKFDYVICENVVEVGRWNRIDDWAREWDLLGYHVDVLCANSAFFGNEQSRDRAFFVMTRKGLQRPNLDFRPPTYCWSCEKVTPGVQTWKRAARERAKPWGPMGKWGPRNQWQYTCETCHDVVSPYILPACRAIDWSIEAPAIGDRQRLGLDPLVPKTMRRLELAMTRVGHVEQLAVISGRDPETQRSRPVWLPAMTQTGRQELGLFGPPREHSLVYLRNNVRPTSVSGDPALSLTASGNHHGLFGTPHGHPVDALIAAYNGSGHNARSVEAPAATLVGTDRLSLLVPVGGTRQTTPVSISENPAPTRMTRDTHAVVEPRKGFDIRDATFRMISPREAVRLMGIHERPDGTPYVVVGNGRDTVRQAGNAVVAILGANVIDRCLTAQGA